MISMHNFQFSKKALSNYYSLEQELIFIRILLRNCPLKLCALIESGLKPYNKHVSQQVVEIF